MTPKGALSGFSRGHTCPVLQNLELSFPGVKLLGKEPGPGSVWTGPLSP